MQPPVKIHAEIRKAKAAIEKVKAAEALVDVESAWKEFLHAYERSCNKVTAHFKRSPKYQGWTGRGKGERDGRRDPFLAYLKNVRDADEHTIEDIMQSESSKIAADRIHNVQILIESAVAPGAHWGRSRGFAVRDGQSRSRFRATG